MHFIRAVNLAVRFFLELCALAAAGYWGATLRAGPALRVTAAVLIPLAIAFFWGLFVSPKATVPTGRIGRAALGLVVFLIAAAMVGDRGHPTLAIAFAVVAVVSSLVVYALPQ